VKGKSVDPGNGEAAGLGQREIRICPVCGTKFSATGDSGLCPVCVLLGAAGRDSALAEALNPVPGSESSSADTEPGLAGHRRDFARAILSRPKG